MPMEKDLDLKHLGFFTTTTNNAFCRAELLYNSLKAYTPSVIAPELKLAEDHLAKMAAPLFTKAQDMSGKLLQFADNKVDEMKELHNSNIKTFNASKEAYFQYMSKTADNIVEQLSVKAVQEATVKNVHLARDTLLSAVKQAREATHPDVAIKMAWDAWNVFAANPAVVKMLETAEPAAKLGQQTFCKLHDALVAAPMYKSIIDQTAETISYAATTTPYKFAQYLYPIVSPVADPAINTVTQSKVICQVLDYWKPVVVVPAY